MTFDSVIGQTRIKRFFQKTLSSRRVSHAYLFVGEKGVGKEAMALEVARALLAGKSAVEGAGDEPTARVAKLAHPDLEFIFPAPRKLKDEEYRRIIASVADNPYLRLEPWANPTISIDQIREIRRKAAYKSYEGGGRVVILTDCERMTPEAANSLLKLLEEPPEKMYLLMLSSRPNLLLPTITSRCQTVKFDPLSVDEIAAELGRRFPVNPEQATLAARLANGSYRRAVELLDEDLQDMQRKALEMFRKAVQNQFMQACYVDELLQQFNRDTKKIRDLLVHLSLWLRDAILLQQAASTAREWIVHTNELDVLQSFTQKFPRADLHSAVHEIEKSFELIERNVQIQLILIVLLNKLRKLLRR